MQMLQQKIRLYGIDAPEVRGAEREDGLQTRDYLRNLLRGEDLVIQTYKDRTGKYGRWLGIIWIDDLNVNRHLVQMELAEINYYR